MIKKFKTAIFLFLAYTNLAFGFEGDIIILSPEGNEQTEQASLIAHRYIFTRWHSQTENCQRYPGACTFQGIPIVNIETFKDYAVMELETEFENYIKPIDEFHELSLPEQHTVCQILAKNNLGQEQEDSCLRIRQRLQR